MHPRQISTFKTRQEAVTFEDSPRSVWAHSQEADSPVVASPSSFAGPLARAPVKLPRLVDIREEDILPLAELRRRKERLSLRPLGLSARAVFNQAELESSFQHFALGLKNRWEWELKRDQDDFAPLRQYLSQSADWLNIAALKLDSPDARYAQALYWLKGLKVKSFHKKAHDVLAELANYGHTASAYELGLLLSKSKDSAIQQDGYQLLARAARNGYPPAKYEYARLSFACHKDPAMLKQAFKLLRGAARSKYRRSYALLGKAYLSGYGVKVDKRKAFTWLEKARRCNDPRCLISLGHCYRKGLGVAVDFEKSFSFYLEATQVPSQRKKAFHSIRNFLLWMHDEGQKWLSQGALLGLYPPSLDLLKKEHQSHVCCARQLGYKNFEKALRQDAPFIKVCANWAAKNYPKALLDHDFRNGWLPELLYIWLRTQGRSTLVEIFNELPAKELTDKRLSAIVNGTCRFIPK